MIWLVFALLTLAAALSVLVPLARARTLAAETASRQALDVAFYESELAAIARDEARGLIGAAEAQAARAEAARRLISAPATPGEPPASRVVRAGAALLALLIVFGVGLGVYLRIGAPHLPDQPLLARRTAPLEQMDTMAAIARVEAHLAANPDDGRGHEVLAPIYMQIGRYEQAANAFAQASRLLGATPQRAAAEAEAHMMAAQGRMVPQARAAIARALALDPSMPQARFYEGLAAEEDGDKARAADLWSRLLADAPPGAPWATTVRAKLEGLGATPPAPPAPRAGPAGEAAAAIASLPPAERMAAVRGMVDGLATRLAADGRDLEGWLRLLRSYVTLGERAKAVEALADARRAMSDDPAGRERLAAAARELGLEN
jgi:cytochrome c-type biogenesis protein CcmH